MKKVTFFSTNERKGLLYLLFATLVYSFLPVLIRKLDAGSIPPISQVSLRYFVAFFVAAVYFVVKKLTIRIERKSIFLLVAVAIFGYGFTNLLFTYGVLLTQVGTALFIFYNYAVITPILGWLVLKEKLSIRSVIALLISLLGLLFLFQPTGFATWKIGALFALGAALTQSFYLVGRKLLPKYSAGFIMLTNTFLGSLSMGILALFFESNFFSVTGILSLSPQTWLLTILFGLGNFVAWFAISKGFSLVKVTTGSLTMLLEVLFSPIIAFMFFLEVPTTATILGGGVILFAVLLGLINSKSAG